MILEQKKLSPNVTINLIKTDKFKTNFVSVSYAQKLSEENAPLNSLIPKILNRGCQQYKDTEAISKRLEELYSSDIFYRVTPNKNKQVVTFSADILDNTYAVDDTNITNETISLLVQLICSPLTENGKFNEKYVSDEKKMLIHDIKSKINNKNRYAVERCKELMCSKEICGISSLGTVESVQAITNEAVYNQYLNLISNSILNIFLIGNFELDSVIHLFEPIISKITIKDLSLDDCDIVRHAKIVRTYEEEISAVQGKLSMGFRTGITFNDKEYSAFPIFNEIFGGSPISKLFMNVREKKSLCYYCSTKPDAFNGIMIVTAGIKNEDKSTAESEIMLQLEEMKKGNISSEEFECAKKSLKNSYKAIYDSPAALGHWYLIRSLNGSSQSPLEILETLDNVTIEDVKNLAKKVSLDTIYFMRGTESNIQGDECDE